jgi:Fe2+ or Zn2+ uptake regulation protein
LQTLVELGFVRRLPDGRGGHFYLAITPSGPRAIFVCNECGRVDAVAVEMLLRLSHAVEETNGYEIQEQYLHLSGLCTDCQGRRGVGGTGQ